jgi:hypothetical protein
MSNLPEISPKIKTALLSAAIIEEMAFRPGHAFVAWRNQWLVLQGFDLGKHISVGFGDDGITYTQDAGAVPCSGDVAGCGCARCENARNDADYDKEGLCQEK